MRSSYLCYIFCIYSYGVRQYLGDFYKNTYLKIPTGSISKKVEGFREGEGMCGLMDEFPGAQVFEGGAEGLGVFWWGF